MSALAMSDFQEWTTDEFRMELHAQLRKLFDADDMLRIKSIDCANYIPDSVAAAMELERSGMPKGGVVQVAIHLCLQSDATTGRLARTMVPRLLKWRDIPRVAQTLATPIAKALGQMDRSEA